MPREIIRSKYFFKRGMEESLNDFQETKTKCIGPKIIKNTKQKAKPKKRVKGQKDIRTLIQKKNELIAFTKDFNNVCTKSGIDIDSQELQLAIALSKSLQEQNQSEAGASQSNKTLTSQERTNQIRRTLQEYGFKVPETKIKSEANKRVKKYKKQYKLLLISEEERRERISDKYSQILFQYPDPEDFYESNYVEDKINKGFYYLCTNTTYNLIKSNDIFYVPELLQEINVKKGSLLRDWSNIPGRPCSPTLINDLPTSVSEIDCTQTELNTILSGTLITAQGIYNSKIKKIISETEPKYCSNHCVAQNNETICEQLLIKPEERKDIQSIGSNINKILQNSTENTVTTMLSSLDRSLSPDIFGDDTSSVIDNTIIYNSCNTAIPNCSKTTNNKEILDLTEPTVINLAVPKPINIPETSDVTKRKSNDFMDLTECVPTFSQKDNTNSMSQSKTCESKLIYNDCMEITECINPSSKFNNDIQNSVTNIEAHIDLVKENDSFIYKEKVTSFDLTQSSNSDDELPMVNIHGANRTQSSSSDTIIVDYDDYGQYSNNEDVIESISHDRHISDNDELIPVEKDVNESNAPLKISNIDLTQSSDNIYVEKNKSISFAKDVSHISDNEDISIPDEEISKNNLNNPLGIRDINLNKSLENVSIEKNNSLSFIQDKSVHITNDKTEPVPIEDVNDSNSNNFLQVTDIDLTQSPENNITEKNSHVSLTQDEFLSISNKEYKPMQVEKENENYSEDPLEVSDIDLIQSSENVNTEKNSCVSFTQNEFLHMPNRENKSMPVEKDNENNSNDPLEMCDIDLTQSSDTSTNIQGNPDEVNIPYNNLGKIGDVSIDYDDVIETNNYCADEQFDDILSKYGTSTSNVTVLSKNSVDNSKNNPSSSYSNTSEVFKISDRELNYSLCKSNVENYQLDDISIKDDNINLDDSDNKAKHSLNRSLSDSCLPSVTFKEKLTNIDKQTEKFIKLDKSVHSTPIKAIIKDDNISVETPTNSEYLIKVREVTPMLDYAAMTSPERNKELEKYGLKPFKRKRAIQLLTHLYNQTHPIVEYCSEEPIPAKKSKPNSPKKNTKSPKKKNSPAQSNSAQSVNTDEGKENCVYYAETKDVPDIRDIECSSDDWIFQKREKAKVHSCRVPLHIAFHNYVSCRKGLREAILRYEPVNIDVIHKDLVSYGYRYNPKDLLKFLDKKCITVKTADNNARNCKK